MAEAGEDGSMLVYLLGLVVLVCMALGLSWDTSNWFLGHRALNNLADGAVVAAAGELDTARYYASNGTDLRLVTAKAAAVVADYVAASTRDSGVRGVRVGSVVVTRGADGPSVTAELVAPSPVVVLRWIGVVPAKDISARATATARPG